MFVGILTPLPAQASDRESEEKVEISIHVRLPSSLEPDSPLVVNDLWTILPLYSHHLEGLSESVRFHRLYLTTTESDISVNPVRLCLLSTITL